jgi:hypothetical protein
MRIGFLSEREEERRERDPADCPMTVSWKAESEEDAGSGG